MDAYDMGRAKLPRSALEKLRGEPGPSIASLSAQRFVNAIDYFHKKLVDTLTVSR